MQEKEKSKLKNLNSLNKKENQVVLWKTQENNSYLKVLILIIHNSKCNMLMISQLLVITLRKIHHMLNQQLLSQLLRQLGSKIIKNIIKKLNNK